MHAVGWNVSDSDLFGVLATKLLSWMFRSVTNKAISPSIVKKKIDPDQKVMANWQSKWVRLITNISSFPSIQRNLYLSRLHRQLVPPRLQIRPRQDISQASHGHPEDLLETLRL